MLRWEIAALKSENDPAIAALNARTDSQNETLKSLGEAAITTSDAVVELEVKVKYLCGQAEQFLEKCLDLEARSKRQNLRIAGVRERGEHGQKTREFMAQLLKDVLNLEVKPVRNRVHRALRAHLGDNTPLRHLILRIHYCHILEEVLQKVTKNKSLLFHRQWIQIFGELPLAIVKPQATFTPARNLLQDKPGVKFGHLYPAKLQVTHKGTETKFRDPEEAQLYAEHHFGQGDD